MAKIRLKKAANEFNIATKSAVEFLRSKGIEVEDTPNAQLEEAAYNALKKEYAKDSELKKASQEVVILCISVHAE